MAMSRGRKRKLALAVVLVAGVAGVGGLYVAQQTLKAQRLARDHEEGMAAYEQGRYEEALQRLSRFVARDKTDPDALLAYADSRREVPTEGNQARALEQALAAVRIASEVEPDNPRARAMRMELAWSLGQLTEANEAAAGVLRLDPTRLDAHQVRIQAARAAGRDPDRIAAAQAMAEALPESFEVQWAALNEMIDAGLSDDDAEAFAEARAEAFPERIAARLLLARVAARRALTARELADAEAQAEHIGRYVSLLAEAAAIPPAEPAEARALIEQFEAVDRQGANVGLQTTSLDLLRRFLTDPDIGQGLTEFAAGRAWQHGDPALLELLTERADEADDLSDAALAWLSLATGEEAYVEQLEARESPEASVWSSVVRAARLIDEGRHAEAREALEPVLRGRSGPASTAAIYFEGVALRGLGETAMAESRLLSLESDPFWARARLTLAEIAFDRGDYWRAYGLLRADQLVGAVPLLMEAALRLEESGFRWPENAASARQMADGLLLRAPDEPVFLAYHARAELAVGNTERAREVAERLLELEPGDGARVVAAFAERLSEVDPDLGSALMERYSDAQADPVERLAGRYDRGEITLEEFREEARRLIESADEGTRLGAELMLATAADRAGDPDAAGLFLALAERHPTDVRVQLAALQSDAIWRRTADAETVIARLRALTGDEGLSWRVYDARRRLIEDRSEPAAARVVNDLAGVLRTAPNNVMALKLMAEAMTRVGDFERAAAHAARAADAEPNTLVHTLDAAEAFVRAGLSEEAGARVVAAASIDSRSAGARLRRAYLLAQFGMAEEAADDWLWLSRNADAETRAQAGAALAQLGRTDEAGRIVESLLDTPDLSARATVRLADALAALGRKGRGVELLGELPPGEGRPHPAAETAAYLARHADGPEDFAELEDYARSADAAEAWAPVVQAYMGQGMVDEAQRVLTEARTLHGDAPPLMPYARALDAGRGLDPNAYLAIARASLTGIEADWAVELGQRLDAALADPQSLDDLLTYLRGFVRTRPQIVLGWSLLAQGQASLGRNGAARETLRLMLETVRANPQAALAATNIYRRMGDLDDALVAAREYESRLDAPTFESSRAIAELALLTNRAGEAWRAIEPWRDELATRAHHALYARAAVESGAVREASAVVWGWDATDHDWARDAIPLADRIRDPDARRSWLNTAAERVRPDDDRARLLLATGWYTLALDTGDRAGLERTLELAEAQASDQTLQARLSRLQAACHSMLGRPEEAEKHYRHAESLDPDDPDTLNNLAYLLLERGGDTAEALGFARRAVAVLREAGAPGEAMAAYLDTLGTAMTRNGDPEGAAAVFEEALEARPGYDYALVGLAECRVELGQPDEARQLLARLRDPSPSLRDRIETVRSALD